MPFITHRCCYHKFPNHFVWVKEHKKSNPHKQHNKSIIACMYSASPRTIEKYCLCLLLLHVTWTHMLWGSLNSWQSHCGDIQGIMYPLQFTLLWYRMGLNNKNALTDWSTMDPLQLVTKDQQQDGVHEILWLHSISKTWNMDGNYFFVYKFICWCIFMWVFHILKVFFHICVVFW